MILLFLTAFSKDPAGSILEELAECTEVQVKITSQMNHQRVKILSLVCDARKCCMYDTGNEVKGHGAKSPQQFGPWFPDTYPLPE